MGCFSFITQDTNESIRNIFEDDEVGDFPVLMIDNKGNQWEEKSYGGYGIFGGKDIFILTSEMNNRNDGTEDEIRERGIDLFYSDRTDVITPNLYRYPNAWVFNRPKDCPYQGMLPNDYDSSDDNYEDEFWKNHDICPICGGEFSPDCECDEDY